MSLNGKVGLSPDSHKLVGGQAHIDLNDAMAVRAGQVMMVMVWTDAVMMRTVGELNTIQQAGIDQHLHRTIDGGAAQARLLLTQCLPEIVNREIGSLCCKGDELLLDELTWASPTLARLVKCGTNLVRYHAFFTPSL
jgi:hypothetical protein